MSVAHEIVELFEDLLDENGIEIPCSDEAEQANRYDGDNTAKLHGTEYYTLVDRVEYLLNEAYCQICTSKERFDGQISIGECGEIVITSEQLDTYLEKSVLESASGEDCVKKYFIIHVRHGRRDGEGYSVLIAIDKEQDAVEQMKERGYFDWIEDVSDTGYVREIPQAEYEQLTATSHCVWEYGCMLGKKVLAQKDFEQARQRSYENWEKDSTDLGFEFCGQWITNPFVEASGRFELPDLYAMYDYYGKDEKGMYECGAAEKVYEFLLKILELDCFSDNSN